MESRLVGQIIWLILQPAADWLGAFDPCQKTTKRRKNDDKTFAWERPLGPHTPQRPWYP